MVMNDIRESATASRGLIADAAQLSLATSSVCLVTVGFGYVFSQFDSSAIRTQGLPIVACCYLIIGAAGRVRVRWLKVRSQRPLKRGIPLTE
jgi:hypothetical protein